MEGRLKRKGEVYKAEGNVSFHKENCVTFISRLAPRRDLCTYLRVLVVKISGDALPARSGIRFLETGVCMHERKECG